MHQSLLHGATPLPSSYHVSPLLLVPTPATLRAGGSHRFCLICRSFATSSGHRDCVSRRRQPSLSRPITINACRPQDPSDNTARAFVTAHLERQAPPPARPAPPGHTTAPPVRPVHANTDIQAILRDADTHVPLARSHVPALLISRQPPAPGATSPAVYAACSARTYYASPGADASHFARWRQ